MTPYYEDEHSVIYCGDCREVLPQLGPVDLVLTDPPYGIGYNPSQYKKWNGDSSEFFTIAGDDKVFDPSFLLHFPYLILWGANHYFPTLPLGNVLIWDKRGSEKLDRMFGDSCEVAWQKVSGARTHVYIVRIQHGGVINADSSHSNNAQRFHPTQKPVALMRWCIEQSNGAQVILDPFMGSGTTLIAAKQLGRKAIGIEISEAYCHIAVERLRQEVLPLTPRVMPTQEQDSLWNGTAK